MKIKVLTEEKNELEIEIDGEDTLVPLLKSYLLTDENVDIATFKREHPLTGRFYLYIRTKKGTPREALERAIDRVKADLSAFLKEFKALKL